MTEQTGAPERRHPIDDAAAPGWERFPGASKVQLWSRNLRSACSATEDAAADWDLTGRATILIGDEMRTCCGAAHRAAVDAGLRFVRVDEEDVSTMPPPSAFKLSAPVVVFLEPGRWMLESESGESDEVAAEMKEVQGRLKAWIKEFDPAHPVVYVTSAFKIGDVVDSLRHVGLFDRFLNVPAPNMEAWGNVVIDTIGRDHCAPSITEAASKVGRLFRNGYAEERREQLAYLRIRRLRTVLDRPLELMDLVNLEARGLVEDDALPPEAEDIRLSVAYHEAGHAAVSVIDSRGKNIPDYASIVPSAYFRGVVVESYDYHSALGDRLTYQAFLHKVRVWLAGRAAEELYLGTSQVSTSCSTDLEKATEHVTDAFGKWGFAPAMTDESSSASNLAVVAGTPSSSQLLHVEDLVREFLRSEYGAVMDMLREHRGFVDSIAERLLVDPILDQQALLALANGCLPQEILAEPLAERERRESCPASPEHHHASFGVRSVSRE